MPSDPAAIGASFARRRGLTFVRIDLEAGALSQRLHDGLTRAGLPVVGVEARHLKAALWAMTHNAGRCPLDLLVRRLGACERAGQQEEGEGRWREQRG